MDIRYSGFKYRQEGELVYLLEQKEDMDRVIIEPVYEVNGVGCRTIVNTDTVFRKSVKHIELAAKGDVDCECLFSFLPSLVTIDLTNFDTSDVVDFDWLFNECTGLEEIDVTNLVSNKARYLRKMFFNCNKLKNIKGLYSWDLKSVEDISEIFAYCESLEEIDVRKWNVNNIEFMDSIFTNCKSITDVDLDCWDTQNVITMRGMFANCINLRNVRFKLDVSNVSDLSLMFYNCINLAKLDLCSFNTDKVVTAEDMIKGCCRLALVELNKERWKRAIERPCDWNQLKDRKVIKFK